MVGAAKHCSVRKVLLVLLYVWFSFVQRFFLPTPCSLPTFSPEKFLCGYHKYILNPPVICCCDTGEDVSHPQSHYSSKSLAYIIPISVFLHYCSGNVCSSVFSPADVWLHLQANYSWLYRVRAVYAQVFIFMQEREIRAECFVTQTALFLLLHLSA